MSSQEKQTDETLSREEWLLQHLEGQIEFNGAMSPEGHIIASTWLIGKSTRRQEAVLAGMSSCVQRLEAINTDMLEESKTLTRITKWLVWLTVALIVVTIALAALTVMLYLKT